MKNRKAADGAGLVAEMLKHGGEKVVSLITDVFNDILDPIAEVPTYWKETCLKVLFKKNDPQMPASYRVIIIQTHLNTAHSVQITQQSHMC